MPLGIVLIVKEHPLDVNQSLFSLLCRNDGKSENVYITRGSFVTLGLGRLFLCGVSVKEHPLDPNQPFLSCGSDVTGRYVYISSSFVGLWIGRERERTPIRSQLTAFFVLWNDARGGNVRIPSGLCFCGSSLTWPGRRCIDPPTPGDAVWVHAPFPSSSRTISTGRKKR